MEQSPSWEANWFQLVKKFPAFYRTRRFITAFTSARQLSLFWASSIQSIPPHPLYWRSILILSSHLSLGLSSGIFPSGFPIRKPIYASPLAHTCYKVDQPRINYKFTLSPCGVAESNTWWCTKSLTFRGKNYFRLNPKIPRQYIPMKRPYLSTIMHGVTSRKIAVNTPSRENLRSQTLILLRVSVRCYLVSRLSR